MKLSRTQAIIACTLIAGMLSAPAFAQNYGLIARGDCPKSAPRMAYVPGHEPAASYKPIADVERYVASLQSELQQPQAQPRERAPIKRSRRLPSR